MASSKRERELARMRAERQAARRHAAETRRRQRLATLASIAAVVVVLALVVGAVLFLRGSKKAAPVAAAPPPPAASTPSASPAAGKPGTCTYTPSGASSKKLAKLPPATPASTTAPVNERIVTSQGEIDVSLLAAKAPCTVNNFTVLSAAHFFDATPCHRLTTQGIFVLQCGDPSGTGSGGPGYKFKDENLTGATYPRGTLAMANSGPDTNGSQFFLVYKDSQLPPSYTPFGTITKGLAVLDKVAAGGSVPAGDGKPKLPVRIVTAARA